MTTRMDLQENAPYIHGLLQRLGFRNVRPSANGFTASCPFHEDRHPSFSISRTGLWMCWSCKAAGNIKKLNIAMGGNEADWKESLQALGVQLRSASYKQKPRKANDRIELPNGFVAYPCEEQVPLAIKKRLEWNTIQHFQLGHIPGVTRSDKEWRYLNRCIIPIIYKGKAVGFHARALLDQMEPRYYNPTGFDIKEHVFNYDSCQSGGEVILVEGAFNAMSMWEKARPNTIAVFGTQFTSAQIHKIISLSPSCVTICFDRDPSKIVNGEERGKQGQRAAKKLGAMLIDVVPVFIMPLPTGKDPNELSAAVLAECHNRRMPYEKVFEE